MRFLPALMILSLTACASGPSKPRIAPEDLVGLPLTHVQQALGTPNKTETLSDGRLQVGWTHNEEKTLDDYKYDPNAPQPPKSKSFFDDIVDDITDDLLYRNDPEPGQTIRAECTLELTVSNGIVTEVDLEYDDNFSNMKQDLSSVCDHHERTLQSYYDTHPDFLSRMPVASPASPAVMVAPSTYTVVGPR